MSVLSHQSFANTATPYWASATVPTSLVSPLSVVDTYGVPTKKTDITTTAGGAGSIGVAGIDNSNPVRITMQQGATQPLNTIAFDVGNVNPVMSLTSSNVVLATPLVINSPLNPQDFSIIPTTSGVELQMGSLGGGGSVISLTNAPVGKVSIMFSSIFSDSNIIFEDKFGNDTTITEKQIQFQNAAGNVAKVGLTGSAAFLGTFTSPLTTPGVLVNVQNGCELQFADATPNVYGIKSTAGVLTFSAPSASDAITIASTGIVTIPNISSGSFVPIGGIVMYSGLVGSLPVNWRVCDGTSGTPDLRDRFIIGSGSFTLGTTGGSSNIATSNLPAHNHGISDPGHAHNVVLSGMFNNGDNGIAIVYAGQGSGGAGLRFSDPNAAQTTTTGITTTNTGGSVAYYPPFYSLAYIMRMT